jgi:hypothetical protein
MKYTHLRSVCLSLGFMPLLALSACRGEDLPTPRLEEPALAAGRGAGALVASVVADSPSGPIAAGTTVSLHSPTWGSDIYYTTDGSDPRTSATRKLYSSPILAGALTLKAYATRVGMTDSAVSSFTYTLAPSSYVDITAYGAVANDGLDDTDEIDAAITAASAVGKAVFVPAGTFQHLDRLELAGADLVGTGPGSILQATNDEEQNIRLQGSFVSIGDIKLTSTATTRKQANRHQRLMIDEASNFHVERVTVEGSSAAGIFTFGGQGGVIRANKVTGTKADGIHNTYATSNVTIEYNEVSGTGDDLIAVVSYRAHGEVDTAPSHHITIRKNTVKDNVHGRGIAVLGGHDITIEENEILRPKHMGLLVASQNSEFYQTHGASNVVLRGNHVEEAGGVYLDPNGKELRYHAIDVTAATNYPVTDVQFIENTIFNSRWRGGLITGEDVGNVTFVGNQIKTASGSGLVIETNFRGSLRFTGNVVEGTRLQGLVYKQPKLSGARVILDANIFRNINYSQDPTQDAIFLEGPKENVSLASLVLTNNIHENPANHTLQYFIEMGEMPMADSEVICGNTSQRPSRVTQGTQCIAARVTATPGAGLVAAGSTIALSSTSGAAIYYTTDGSNPVTSVTRRHYTSPIVAGNFTLKAYATRDGMQDSAVASFVYSLDPSSYVDITTEGAIPNDGVDDTLAITGAIGLAEVTNKAVFIPAGTFQHSGTLVSHHVDLIGTGPASILLATNPQEQDVRVHGTGVTVSDLKLLSTSTVQGSDATHHRLVFLDADHFIVERVVVEGASGSGIHTALATHGVIRANTVSNTLRSGIYVTHASSELDIDGNTVFGTGDDLIAIASYQVQGGDPVSDITVRGNGVSGNTQGAGISVRGGKGITLDSNRITEPYVAGIYIASGNSSGTHGVSDVVVRKNEVHVAGGQTARHGALMVNANGQPVTNVTFVENEVIDSRDRGILLLGASIGSVHFERNHLSGTGSAGILIDGLTGTASFVGNTLESTDGPAFQHKEPQAAASITLDGNTFRDINRSSTSGAKVIAVEQGALSTLTVTDNVHATPLSYPLQYFLQEEVTAATQVISGNSSPLPSRINGAVVPTP